MFKAPSYMELNIMKYKEKINSYHLFSCTFYSITLTNFTLCSMHFSEDELRIFDNSLIGVKKE